MWTHIDTLLKKNIQLFTFYYIKLAMCCTDIKIIFVYSFTPSSNGFLVYICVYIIVKVCLGAWTHITLDLIGQTSSLWFNSDCRRSVCALDVGVVVVAVIELEKERKKKRCKIVCVQLSTTFSYGVKNQAAHITQVNGALLGRLVHWRVSHHCEVLQVLNTLGSVLGLNKNKQMRQWASLQM